MRQPSPLNIFGREVAPAELDALVPDVFKLAGIRHFREDNGAGSGQRIIRIESGGGLAVELLPDRTCDIGQVWQGKIPFGWIGPIGTADPAGLNANQPLSGLMSTCGFDHIRQPERDGDLSYPLHGSMRHQSSTILFAGPVETERGPVLQVIAEAVQFSLQAGGMRLRRSIDVPLGANTLVIDDTVTVLAKPQAVMAMYHINLGFPMVSARSRLSLGETDITAEVIAEDGIRVRASDEGLCEVRLDSTDDRKVDRFSLSFDGTSLPYFQTLRDSSKGINLLCLEPATHDRALRPELRERDSLALLEVGETVNFRLSMRFESDVDADVR